MSENPKKQQQLAPGSQSLHASEEFFVRICLIGDVEVGKSNLMSRYVNGNLPEFNTYTIWVDFGIKKINSVYTDQKGNEKKTLLKVQVWDTAGRPAFRGITSPIVKNCGILVVYEISRNMPSLSEWCKLYGGVSTCKHQI